MPTVQSTDFIQYGRRHRKQPAYTAGVSIPMSPSPPSSIGSMEGLLPKGVHPQKVKVLPPEVWKRIQYNLVGRKEEIEKLKRDKEEHEKRHDEMTEAVKEWPSTLAGDRKFRLVARKIREEAAEEDRKEIDLAEAEFQAGKRKAAIEKAKTGQYFQTDTLKTLHGALRLTDVLMERDAQLKLKNSLTDRNKEKEAEMLKKSKKEAKRVDMEEQLKARERYLRRREDAHFYIIQANKKKNQEKLEKEEGVRAREYMQKYADFCNWESEKLEQLKLEEKGAIKAGLDEQIQNKREIEGFDKLLQDEEDRETKLFSFAKRKVTGMRKKKETDYRQEGIKRRGKMADEVNEVYQAKSEDNDALTKRQMEEKNAKADKEAAMLAEKRRVAVKDIVKNLKDQMKEKEEIAKEEKLKGLFYRKQIESADKLWLEKKAVNEEEKLKKNKELQDYQLNLINDRAEVERVERNEELRNDHCLNDLLLQEEKEVEKFAKQTIKEVESQGYNSYPLRKVAETGSGGGRGPRFERAAGMRPSFMTADRRGSQLPTYKRDSTDKVRIRRRSDDIAVSRRRLGFNW